MLKETAGVNVSTLRKPRNTVALDEGSHCDITVVAVVVIAPNLYGLHVEYVNARTADILRKYRAAVV